MVTTTDAKNRATVRLPNGTRGTLTYCPPPDGETVKSPPWTGRGTARSRRFAVVVQAGRRRRVPPGDLVVVSD